MFDSPCLPHDAQLLATLLKAFGQQGEVPVFGDGSQRLGPVSQHQGYCPVTPVCHISPVPGMFTPPHPGTGCFLCLQSLFFYGVSQSMQ